MDLLRDLPLRDDDGKVRVVVESPKGSRVKLAYDAHLGAFTWSRTLPMGVVFPFDFGLFPRTLADDGDPLDAVVISGNGTHPGVIVAGRVIGALRIEQQRDGGPVKRNDRIAIVPSHEAVGAEIRDLADVSARVRDELAAFYQASLALTGKQVWLRGWADAAEAIGLLDDAAARYTASLTPA